MKFRVLKRRVELGAGPLECFDALSAGGTREGHFLLETADASQAGGGTNLLLLSPCVRLVAGAQNVALQAITENGRALLRGVAEKAARHATHVSTDSVILEYGHQQLVGDELMRLQRSTPLDAVRALLNSFVAAEPDDATQLVVAGVFDFETIEWMERLPAFAGERKQDLCSLYVAEIVVRFPKDSRRACLTAVVFDGEQEARVENDLSRRIAEIADQLEQLESRPLSFGPSSPDATPNIDDVQFGAQVERAKAHLFAGDAFQIVLSRHFDMPCSNPLLAYQALRHENPSPYMFYMAGNGYTLFGASPESAVKVDGRSRVIEVSPIAGTRARGRGASGEIELDLDARIEADLRTDEKEIAEHMMLVDLARNDVARVCVPGTRNVRQLHVVERYSRVMHLVSRVCGVLRQEIDALRAFAVVMPMGTLSGAPKLRAIEIIREIEGRPRGAYGGAVGYIDAAGNMDTAIVIRAAYVRNGIARVQAGAGVVLRSDPLSEALETQRKADSVLRAIACALQLEANRS